MSRTKKSPRTWRAHEVFAQRERLHTAIRNIDRKKTSQIDETRGNTEKFFTKICNLKPYSYQLELAKLYKTNQFLAVRWPRQTGKSTSIGALLLQDAWENADLNIGFVGPSWRQTKLNIRRVANFCRNLPPQSLHMQKTRISFSNGSVIEAFPNNPDTIRGNTFHRIWWDETNFTSE